MVTPVSTSNPVTTGTSTSATNTTSTNGTTASSASNSTTNSAKTAAQALITSLGSGSGVDVNSLATNLANAEIAPQKANIQGKIDKSNAMISGFGAIKYVLSNLQTAFADLKDRSDFSGITSNNSQPNAFTVSTDSTANAGTHNIVVNSLAQSQRNLSTGFSALTDQLNGGSGFSLTLTINGTSTPITVADGQDTPQGIVSAINAAGTNVKATLINTGAASKPFRMVLTGSTGSANLFSISSTGLTAPAIPPSPTVNPTATATQETSIISLKSGLLNGQSLTIAGLTYTANQDLTASEVATAFDQLKAGDPLPAATTSGSFSGSLTGFNFDAVTGDQITATSTIYGNVSDLVVDPSRATVQTTPGIDASHEVTLTAGLSAGESLTIGGLTFTAGKDLTSDEVANAFSNLNDGAQTKAGAPKGTYSGTLSGFHTSSANGSTLSFINTPGDPVVPLTVSTTAAPDFFRWSNIQNAADASLNVDGVDIVSGVNSVTGAIPGVTLDLTAPTTGSNGASINLTRDTTSVKTKVQNLVNAYNDTITMLNVVSDPKSTVDTYGGTLVGNAIVSTIRNKVRDMVIGYPHNATQGTKALRDLGVTIDKNGQLQIDNTKLDGALKNNFDDMVKMLSNDQEQLTQFSTTPAGLAGEAYRSLTTILDPIGGTISTLSQNQSNKVTEYQKQLDALQIRLQEILKRYTNQFSAMDALVGQIKSVQTGLKSTFDGMMATYTKN